MHFFGSTWVNPQKSIKRVTLTNSKTLLFQPSVSLVKLQAAKEEETTTKDTNEIIKIKTLNIIEQAIRYHQNIPE